VRLAVAALLVLVSATASAQQPGWDVRAPERVEVALGGSAAVEIAIAVDRGLRISKDAPVIVDLAMDGVSTKKRRLGRPDAVDPEADAPRFAVAIKADTAGEHVVKIRVRLWLCGGKVCRPLDVKRQTTVVVAPAASDAGP
jgi:hypothetical protein